MLEAKSEEIKSKVKNIDAVGTGMDFCYVQASRRRLVRSNLKY